MGAFGDHMRRQQGNVDWISHWRIFPAARKQTLPYQILRSNTSKSKVAAS
jgi:hypothetical protein